MHFVKPKLTKPFLLFHERTIKNIIPIDTPRMRVTTAVHNLGIQLLDWLHVRQQLVR